MNAAGTAGVGVYTLLNGLVGTYNPAANANIVITGAGFVTVD